MHEFLYRLSVVRPEMLTDGPTPEEQAVVTEHAGYIQDLADRGVVTLAGRTQTNGPETFGIVILVADDDTAARSIMAQDPAVRDGVMDAVLYPFRTAFTATR